MSSEQNVSDVTDSNSVENQQDQSQNPSGTDVVKYSTFSKVLGEKKAMQEKYNLAMEKLAQLENDKLSAEGKKDELLKNLSKERDELKQKFTGAVQTFARQVTGSHVKSLASQMGCIDADAVTALYQSKIDSVETDDNFNPNSEQLKAILESARTEKPYLFQKASPKIDTTVSTGGQTEGKKKDYSKMTPDELKKEIERIDKLEGKTANFLNL